MLHGSRLRWALFGAGCAGAIAAFGACAAGSEVDDVFLDDGGTGSRDAARTKLDAGGPTVAPDTGTDDDAGNTDDGGVLGDGGGGDSGTGSCTSPNNCVGATTMGSISGDTGKPTAQKDGNTSQWFFIRLTEDDNSVLGSDLKARIDLTSPAGTNYDLYVYVPGSDTRACAAATHTATGATGTDTVNVAFGEGTVANGSDDSRPISIEVRHVSGPCDAAHKWTLKVSGNP